MEGKQVTVGEYVNIRLQHAGIGHVFGVPGDFVLGYLKSIERQGQISFVGTCTELNAAYAADGYARIRGLGALVTTYAVGELSALNGVAGAFSEGVPVVSVVGMPTRKAIRERPMLHHTLGDYYKPKAMAEYITCSSAVLIDERQVPEQVDNLLLACLENQSPVYLGIPQDMVDKPCAAPVDPNRFQQWLSRLESDQEALKEALQECSDMVKASKRPVIVVGDGIRRFKLQKQLEQLVNTWHVPYATTMMGKCVLDEDNPHFIGLYQGKSSRTYVQERVEKADCILMLGFEKTDFNTGGFSSYTDPTATIEGHLSCVRIKNHVFQRVYLHHFIDGLIGAVPPRDPSQMDIHYAVNECVHRPTKEHTLVRDQKVTLNWFFDRISSFIQPGSIVFGETGTAQFAVAETLMPRGCAVISQIFYGSIGYTVGACLGAALAAPNRPVVLFIGDGSLQMTGQEVSTMIRHGLDITVFLINNDGYSIERAILDGSFNDIQPWKYHMLPEVFGGCKGQNVFTEGELEDALKQIKGQRGLKFVEFHVERMDTSKAMERVVENMKKVAV